MDRVKSSKFWLAGVALALFPVVALAVDLTSGIQLLLPNTGEGYNLHSASKFDSLTINSSTFVFSLSDGQTIGLTSPDRRPFTTDQSSATITCDSDQSKVYWSVVAGASATTITITPGTGTCGSSSSGGGSPSVGGSGGGGISAPSVGGGGGGGGSVPVLAPIIPQILAPVVAQLSETTVKVVSSIFSADLDIGAKGDDVSQLQAYLAKDKSIYPEGKVTGYFGSLTRAAVRRFQAKHGISQVGRVGPLTRQKLDEIFGKGVSIPLSVPSSDGLIQSLFGQIKALQDKINALKVAPAPISVPAPAPVSVPTTPSLITPPPPQNLPSWMQLSPIPRAGGSSVVDPGTGSVGGGAVNRDDLPFWMRLTPSH